MNLVLKDHRPTGRIKLFVCSRMMGSIIYKIWHRETDYTKKKSRNWSCDHLLGCQIGGQFELKLIKMNLFELLINGKRLSLFLQIWTRKYICSMIWNLTGTWSDSIRPWQNLKWFDQSVRQACKVNNAAILIGGDFNLPGWDWENKF